MCKLFLRLVPYVWEDSPRHEAATKTIASSQAAPEARTGKHVLAVLQKQTTVQPTLSHCEGGRAGKVAGVHLDSVTP